MQTMAVVGAQRPLPGTSQRRHICRRRPGSEFRLQTVRRRYWQCNGAARCTSNHRRCALPPDRAAPGWPEFSRPRSRPALAKQPDRCRTPGTSRQTHHPPVRATVSMAPTSARRRLATSINRKSPAAWPCVSSKSWRMRTWRSGAIKVYFLQLRRSRVQVEHY